jgi:hypothetical protein
MIAACAIFAGTQTSWRSEMNDRAGAPKNISFEQL